jgi:hypothetical protein
MKVEIDQSNRLDEAGPTFLALANHVVYVIKIPSKVKQLAITLLETKGLSRKQIKPLLWTACLFLLLKNYLNKFVKDPTKIIIDNEYDGYQVAIKRDLLRYIRTQYDEFPAHKIVIKSIGKKSPAHDQAIKAKRKRRSVNKVITERDLLKMLT